MRKRILVTGAGGFIGHHLVRFLKRKGYWVRGVDIKYPEYSSKKEADEFYKIDLRELKNCLRATRNIDWVFNLAADMGGIGYITEVRANIMHNNSLININMAEASKTNRVKRFLFTSSACVYSEEMQMDADLDGLEEDDAFPASPDTEYGWEKIYAEILFNAYQKDYGLDIRIARLHNIYGPEGTYKGGREKAPAAICRKIAEAKYTDTIEIWGDGKQTRSFCYIKDCLEGLYKLMISNYNKPVNIGSDRLVTINELVDIIAFWSYKDIKKKYLLDKPQGVRGRNSDNTRAKKILKWGPKTALEHGLFETYMWIENQCKI